MKLQILLSAALLLSIAFGAQAQPVTYDIKDYGAVGDGSHMETAAINKAVGECALAGGGTVIVPPGRYLSGTVQLLSHVTLDIEAGATLLASQSPADYLLIPDPYAPSTKLLAPLVYATDANNIAVTGRGTIDGQGKIWWDRIEYANPKLHKPGTLTEVEAAEAAKVANGRPHLVRLFRCKDVLIQGLHLINSPEWNVDPVLCNQVRIDGLTIEAPPSSHNTDGVDPVSCSNVQISNCLVDVGDDCITLKSGLNKAGRDMGRADEDITITNCVMLHGHGGVTIGSEMSGGVRNVTVSNCIFHGTDIGVRIKSQRGRGGVVENVVESNLIMQDVPHPFVITSFYMGKDKPTDVFPVDEGTPVFRNFMFNNILATGAKDAGSITGLKEMPVGSIVFNNVKIEAESGFTCTNAKGIAFNNTTIGTASGPQLTLTNSTDIDHSGLTSGEPMPAPATVETK